MHVVVIKDGKEHNQGVAYLDDGTMIVVEDGRSILASNRCRCNKCFSNICGTNDFCETERIEIIERGCYLELKLGKHPFS